LLALLGQEPPELGVVVLLHLPREPRRQGGAVGQLEPQPAVLVQDEPDRDVLDAAGRRSRRAAGSAPPPRTTGGVAVPLPVRDACPRYADAVVDAAGSEPELRAARAYRYAGPALAEVQVHALG